MRMYIVEIGLSLSKMVNEKSKKEEEREEKEGTLRGHGVGNESLEQLQEYEEFILE